MPHSCMLYHYVHVLFMIKNTHKYIAWRKRGLHRGDHVAIFPGMTDQYQAVTSPDHSLDRALTARIKKGKEG